MRKEGGAKWHSQTARPTLDSGVGVVTLSHLTDITEEVGNNCPSFLPRTTFSLWSHSHVVTTPIILRQAPQCCRITLRANYISPWGVCSRHTLDFASLLSALGPGPRFIRHFAKIVYCMYWLIEG